MSMVHLSGYICTHHRQRFCIRNLAMVVFLRFSCPPVYCWKDMAYHHEYTYKHIITEESSGRQLKLEQLEMIP